MKQNSIRNVKKFMGEFSRSSGLKPESSQPKRYLWTDAFAVCNYLELYRLTNNKDYLDLAIHLVDQVHHILGKQRPENPKTGWISGLNEGEGEIHPTLGGLRIGKDMNERMPDEPYNQLLEWDRDGQYYHYLTKWMHALNCTARVTGNIKYINWASELAKTAHAAFTYLPSSGSEKRMYWKMSIDLTRPMVPSMGQHDPLDGFITYKEIQARMMNYKTTDQTETILDHEIQDMESICRGMVFTTDDPLGIGGLLSDATRITQLMNKGSIKHVELLETVLASSLIGLRSYTANNPMNIPADYRLAFRELGISIGLKGYRIIRELLIDNPNFFTEYLEQSLKELKQYLELANTIEMFWLDDKNRETRNWKEHMNINTVMLATSLAPTEFLRI